MNDMPGAEPRLIKPEDIAPKFNWGRAIPAPGHMAVDFEERIDFRRLHNYRVARARQAMAKAGLGALLTFDANNIRYLTSTVIGEWSRDKMSRYALLAGNSDPHSWDFGSAATHHRRSMPWTDPKHFHAGMLGLRGAVPPSAANATRASSNANIETVAGPVYRKFPTIIVKVFNTAAPETSTTSKENVKLPAAVGVPVTNRSCPSVNPGGNGPTMRNRYGSRPPEILRPNRYGTPTAAPGNDAVEIRIGCSRPSTVITISRSWLASVLSVTRSVNTYRPG